MKTLEYTAENGDAGQRADAVLARVFPELTRSRIQQLMEKGLVLCGNRPAVKNRRLSAGETLCIQLPYEAQHGLTAQDIPLDIIYEDDAVIVVNKPKGMVVHPAAGNSDGTLVNALLHHCGSEHLSHAGDADRPGIVHRIDKDTSGLLVCAKTDQAYEALVQQFSVHSITRVYQAVVYGGFSQNEGFVEGNIGRDSVNRKRMAVVKEGGKYAYTGYRVEERLGKFTHLSLRLKTGRTHQIRVHLASIGHPVAGDPVYGPHKVITQTTGQCLHAGTLGFVHPVTGEYLQFDSPLPEYFTAFVSRLKREM